MKFKSGMVVVVGAFMLCLTLNVLAGDLKGNLTIGAGYLENPLGIAQESSAGYASQILRIFTLQQKPVDQFKLGYELEASQFGSGTNLGSLRHGLGWEWLRGAQGSPGAIGMGIQYALRNYQSTYEYYDYRDLNYYAVWKTYPRSDVMFKATGTFRYRVYPDLPEESFLEPRLKLEAKRFYANRTTLGLECSLGRKYFNDSVASQVWETPHLPSTSQLAARLNFARGLNDRVGIRGWAEQRFSLEGFPHYVGDDVYDSPLLDFYAHEGTDALAAIKWLSPLLVWVETGLTYGHHDYGDLLFGTETGGVQRVDTVRDYFLGLNRAIKMGSQQARFTVQAGWRDQDSTLDTYTLAGAFFSSSLVYPF